MSRILLIGQGLIAKEFARIVRERFGDAHQYDFVGEELQDTGGLPGLMHHNFDPTSLFRLAPLLRNGYKRIYLVWEALEEAVVILKHLRREAPDTPVTLVDFWAEPLPIDPGISVIPVAESIAARLVDFLPSVPVVAQNIGLGQGEIMEVMVPANSPFAYRHLSSIEQRSWRVVALYRNRQFVLTKPSTLIRPNDTLLLVGTAHILQDVYRLIKSRTGQFPAPFGKHLYLFLDANEGGYVGQEHLLDETLWLRAKLGRKLIIRYTNLAYGPLYERVTQLCSEEIEVLSDYRNLSARELIASDVRQHGVGLVIVDHQTIREGGVLEFLRSLRRPVLKIGRHSLATLSELALILTTSPAHEKISPTLFDLAAQLGLQLTLYDYDPDNEPKSSVIEHYEHLARIHERPIQIITGVKNPIRELQKLFNVLHALPFEQGISEGGWHDLFALDPQRLYWKLEGYTQIFIPAEE